MPKILCRVSAKTYCGLKVAQISSRKTFLKQTMDIVGCESPGLDANFWGQPQGKSIAEWIYRGMCRRSAEEQENHIYCPPGDLRVKHGG